MDELMNVKEAATYLRLNFMTVYKLIQKRRIPAIKVGGNWRFKKEILDKWLLQNTTNCRGNILIVDDDESVRDVLQDMVQKQGFTVLTVSDGESALNEINDQHFDLIFLDLRLPGLNGAGVMKEVKNKTKDTIVVVVTGYADDPVALEAMSYGPLLLVRKPFREKDIIEVLSMVKAN